MRGQAFILRQGLRLLCALPYSLNAREIPREAPVESEPRHPVLGAEFWDLHYYPSVSSCVSLALLSSTFFHMTAPSLLSTAPSTIFADTKQLAIAGHESLMSASSRVEAFSVKQMLWAKSRYEFLRVRILVHIAGCVRSHRFAHRHARTHMRTHAHTFGNTFQRTTQHWQHA